MIKFFLPLIPAIWKVLSGGWKIALTAIALVIITGYTVLVSWGALRSEMISAYDNRWHELDQRQEHERSQTIKSIQMDISLIKRDQSSSSSDIREIRNALLNRQK